MIEKPVEYWFVLMGLALRMIFIRAEEAPILMRLGKTASSAMLSLGLSESAAPYFGGSELLAGLAIMSLGLLLLDSVSGIFADREFFKELVRLWLGRSK